MKTLVQFMLEKLIIKKNKSYKYFTKTKAELKHIIKKTYKR